MTLAEQANNWDMLKKLSPDNCWQIIRGKIGGLFSRYGECFIYRANNEEQTTIVVPRFI